MNQEIPLLYPSVLKEGSPLPSAPEPIQAFFKGLKMTTSSIAISMPFEAKKMPFQVCTTQLLTG